MPEGIVRTVHGGGAVGNALVESTAAKIFFTGSVDVGRRRRRRVRRAPQGLACSSSAARTRRSSAPTPTSSNAISGCLWGSFANAGQTCAGIERVYVVEEVAERFIEGVVRGAQALRVGDPLSFDTEIGPMVSRDQYELVKELVDDAVANGAELRCGGPVEVDGYADAAFYAPTVLTNVTHDMRIMREEIFGPVVPIVTVDSEEEAIRLANDSNFGLSRRSGRSTATRATGSRAASRPARSGSTTTCTRTAPASARGAASRSPASAARTRSSASTSA